jgi:hypothetical protein
MFPYSLFRRNFITPSSTVMRRAVCERVGEFETALLACEDLDYWLRCAALGARFLHLKECHVMYRKNHDQAATRGFSRLNETFAQVVERHLTTFKNVPFDCRKLAARLYFNAAWSHATLSPAVDPTADPRRAPKLFRRACELHSRKTKYWIHHALHNLCDRLGSRFFKSQLHYWFHPKRTKFLVQTIPTP